MALEKSQVSRRRHWPWTHDGECSGEGLSQGFIGDESGFDHQWVFFTLGLGEHFLAGHAWAGVLDFSGLHYTCFGTRRCLEEGGDFRGHHDDNVLARFDDDYRTRRRGFMSYLLPSSFFLFFLFLSFSLSSRLALLFEHVLLASVSSFFR